VCDRLLGQGFIALAPSRPTHEQRSLVQCGRAQGAKKWKALMTFSGLRLSSWRGGGPIYDPGLGKRTLVQRSIRKVHLRKFSFLIGGRDEEIYSNNF